jgi:hypothetical protein
VVGCQYIPVSKINQGGGEDTNGERSAYLKEEHQADGRALRGVREAHRVGDLISRPEA